MSYTVTYDASPEAKVKLSGSHAIGRDRHLGREADIAAGFMFRHTNVNIDSSRTALNVSFVNDGEGGFRKPVVTVDELGRQRPPSAEFEDYREGRLRSVKGRIRSDAVVMRGVMLQLDPRWFEDHCPTWRETGLTSEAQDFIAAQLDWACHEFGQANIVGGSIDLDETSPHLQLSIIPVTDDGRLSQKDFFRGPADLRRQRKDLLDTLAHAGYDPNYAVTERSTTRTSSVEFGRDADRVAKQLTDLERQGERLRNDQTAVYKREADVLLREQAVARREVEADERQRQLREELAALPKLRRRVAAQARDEAKAETAAQTDALREALRGTEAERRQLAQLAAQRPPMPTVAEILNAQSAHSIKWLRGKKLQDGRTIYDHYEQSLRQEFAKRSASTRTTKDWDNWLSAVHSRTHEKARAEHEDRIAKLKSKASEFDTGDSQLER